MQHTRCGRQKPYPFHVYNIINFTQEQHNAAFSIILTLRNGIKHGENESEIGSERRRNTTNGTVGAELPTTLSSQPNKQNRKRKHMNDENEGAANSNDVRAASPQCSLYGAHSSLSLCACFSHERKGHFTFGYVRCTYGARVVEVYPHGERTFIMFTLPCTHTRAWANQQANKAPCTRIIIFVYFPYDFYYNA